MTTIIKLNRRFDYQYALQNLQSAIICANSLTLGHQLSLALTEPSLKETAELRNLLGGRNLILVYSQKAARSYKRLNPQARVIYLKNSKAIMQHQLEEELNRLYEAEPFEYLISDNIEASLIDKNMESLFLPYALYLWNKRRNQLNQKSTFLVTLLSTRRHPNYFNFVDQATRNSAVIRVVGKKIAVRKRLPFSSSTFRGLIGRIL